MRSDRTDYLACDTIYYQGNNCSQTQALRYTGSQRIMATTGEIMWSIGRNQLPPLKVIYNLHIGTEILDVNLNAFDSYTAYFNPLKQFFARKSRIMNEDEGVQILSAISPSPDSVKFHTPNLSYASLGQGPDMRSHLAKYRSWQARADKKQHLILWGVSRGTAATFNALARHKYPEVKLVVLEGAIDSMDSVVKNIMLNYSQSDRIADGMVSLFNTAISFFSSKDWYGYKPEGESPLKMVNEFPENVPVVFITSKIDNIVPPQCTRNIATTLAARGKNDVYLLVLEKSSHPYYMYDDKEDRDKYEAFMHAIYKIYGLQHEPDLAEKGAAYINDAILFMRTSVLQLAV